MKKIVFLITFSLTILAHEGHDIPGALPIAPHGGVLKEAHHIHKGSHHHHGKAIKREIFFEGKYENNKIYIYPLELEGEMFTSLKVAEMSDIKIKVIDGRSRKEISGNLEPQGKSWVFTLKKTRARRFLIKIDVLYKKAPYKAIVQVEKN